MMDPSTVEHAAALISLSLNPMCWAKAVALAVDSSDIGQLIYDIRLLSNR